MGNQPVDVWNLSLEEFDLWKVNLQKLDCGIKNFAVKFCGIPQTKLLDPKYSIRSV